MTMMNLGEEMHIAVLAIQDKLDQAQALRLLDLVIKQIKMVRVGKPAIWIYPIGDGVGGTGETVLQPFMVGQPLAESLSMTLPGAAFTDSWHDHEGFYLIICSCRPFGTRKLIRWLYKRGFKVLDLGWCYASLKPRKRSWLWRWICGG